MCRGTVSSVVEALRNERLSITELQRLVNKRVRAAIASAYRSVPYYHGVLKGNDIHPADIRSARDLRKIPTTTKEDVRRQGLRMLAVGVDTRKLEWRRTSGTSGKPLLLARGPWFNRVHRGMEVRRDVALASFPWQKTAHIVHSQSDPARRSHSRWGLLGRARRIFRRLFFLDTIGDAARVIRELSEFRPERLVSHAYNLRLLALYKVEESAPLEPEIIHTGAGEVADAETTKFLEESFGCPAYGIYGAREFGLMGFECLHKTGYHINVDDVYGEYLEDGEHVEEGEIGDTVWTSLSNRTMPLLRYELGDLAVPSGEICPCGRNLPLLRSIEGRREDLVVLHDGRAITPARILSVLHRIRGLARFRLVQKTHERFELDFTRSLGYTEETIGQTHAACKILFGGDVDLRIYERDLSRLPVKWGAVVSELRSAPLDQ